MNSSSFIEFHQVKINELVGVLLDIQRKYGNLPIYTFNENDDTTIYDYIWSDTIEVSIGDIIQIDDKIYIKDSDYEKWFSDTMDSHEDLFIEVISKRHPELRGLAIKILRDETVDEDWEDGWIAIDPIIYHYYLNDLDWKQVVLVTNCN